LNRVLSGLARTGKHPSVRAIFVEKNARAFGELQKALVEYSGSVKTSAFEGTFEANIARISQAIGSTFAFVFIDPTGWTGFAMDNIRPLLRNLPGEVMINLMYDFINRFLNEDNQESLDRLFGTPDWRTVPKDENRESALVELYKEQVRSAGAFRFATSTRILKPIPDRAYFHLIYSTRSPKGILEFRRVEQKTMKEQDSVRDTAKRRDREHRTGQAEIAFGVDGPSPLLQEERSNQLAKAESRVLRLLQHGPISFRELQPQILELPLVWEADLDRILLAGHKRGRFIIAGMGPRDRKPKSACMIGLASPRDTIVS
jgi:three-Cys-motif partner protein